MLLSLMLLIGTSIRVVSLITVESTLTMLFSWLVLLKPSGGLKIVGAKIGEKKVIFAWLKEIHAQSAKVQSILSDDNQSYNHIK